MRARRATVRTLALVLLPLMAVGPERVEAMAVEASLYRVCGAAALGAVPGPVTWTYARDDAGNTTSETDGARTDTYAYDVEGRLVGATQHTHRQTLLPVGHRLHERGIIGLRWQARTARRLGIESSLRQRGRPPVRRGSSSGKTECPVECPLSP